MTVIKAARYVLAAFCVITINFLIPRAMPGDPLTNILGEDVQLSAEQRRELSREMGFNLPVGRQYVRYLSRLAHLDLGYSYYYNRDVAELLHSRIRWTLLLAAPSVVIGAVLGALAGSLVGFRAEAPGGRLATIGTLSLYSIPPYFLALMLLYFFSFRLGLFPLKGYYTTGGAADVVHHLALPVATLTVFTTTRNFMVMRGSVLQERHRHYVMYARSKGLTAGQVLFRHIFRNASLPLITILALDIGFILSGALFVEIIFSMNGMGTLIYDAVKARDYPVLQGAFLAVTFMVMCANAFSDLLYGIIDPRVRKAR